MFGGVTSDSMPAGGQVAHGTPGLDGGVEVATIHALDAHQLLPLSLLAHSLLVLVPFTQKSRPSLDGT